MAPHVKVTPELRKKVVELKTSRTHLAAVSREVGRSKIVISRILKLYDENKTLTSPSNLGRRRITTVREDTVMKRSVNKDSFHTAAAIFQKIMATSNKDVSRFIVSRRLNEFGLSAGSPATKPLISKKNKIARLSYAEAHVL